MTSFSNAYETSALPREDSTRRSATSINLRSITIPDQNKLHYGITGHTAGELIARRADAGKPNMGLTTWKGTKVRKGDVAVAKNYLNEEELKQLNLIVTMYLDYAELQARHKHPLYMKDWRKKLNAFLKFNERDILTNAGQVSMEVAQQLALNEYEKFNHYRLKQEDTAGDPDFDRLAKDIESKIKRKQATENKNG